MAISGSPRRYNVAFNQIENSFIGVIIEYVIGVWSYRKLDVMVPARRLQSVHHFEILAPIENVAAKRAVYDGGNQEI